MNGASMKHSLRSLKEMKLSKTPITWLTCYDYSFASVLDSTDLDMILVGDSGGMVLLGYSDTVPVTMNEMIQLASSVRRGAPSKFIIGDMPKGSYEGSNEEAIKNAMRFIKESSCDAVKLEGGIEMSERVRAISGSGIPVVGHIGLTPQSAIAQGGYRVIGRVKDEKNKLFSDAKKLTDSGAFAILLEAMPPDLAAKISSKLEILIMGIGAGPQVDGQLLILHDLLGLYPNFRPKFAKCYIPAAIEEFIVGIGSVENLVAHGRSTRNDGFREIARLAVNLFIKETKAGIFPSSEYSYKN